VAAWRFRRASARACTSRSKMQPAPAQGKARRRGPRDMLYALPHAPPACPPSNASARPRGTARSLAATSEATCRGRRSSSGAKHATAESGRGGATAPARRGRGAAERHGQPRSLELSCRRRTRRNKGQVSPKRAAAAQFERLRSAGPRHLGSCLLCARHSRGTATCQMRRAGAARRSDARLRLRTLQRHTTTPAARRRAGGARSAGTVALHCAPAPFRLRAG
jgi:hypothetical protein